MSYVVIHVKMILMNLWNETEMVVVGAEERIFCKVIPYTGLSHIKNFLHVYVCIVCVCMFACVRAHMHVGTCVHYVRVYRGPRLMFNAFLGPLKLIY